MWSYTSPNMAYKYSYRTYKAHLQLPMKLQVGHGARGFEDLVLEAAWVKVTGLYYCFGASGL